MWGKDYDFDTEPSKKILGIKYKDAKTSAVELTKSLIANGLIPDQISKKNQISSTIKN